jgi:hypothetical protein
MMGQGSPLAERLFGSWAREFNLGPMWFIWYLLVFATVAPAVGWAAGRLAARVAPERLAGAGRVALRLALVPLALALVSLPGRMESASYAGWALGGATGIFQGVPDVFFRWQADWPFYFAYFLTGWWLYHARAGMAEVGKTWVPTLLMGFITYLAAVKFSETYSSQNGRPDYALLRVAGHGLFALSCAFLSWGFLGLFQRFLDRPTKLGRYLADTSFWMYLLHQELLIQGILPWLRPYNLSWWLQTTLAVALVTVIACVTFELFIRRTPLTHLFGPPPRRKPKQPAVPAEAVAAGGAGGGPPMSPRRAGAARLAACL